MTENKTRVNVYMADSLIERVDAYRAPLGLSRSAALLSLAMTTLNQQQTMSDLGKLLKLAEQEDAKRSSN